MYFVSAFLFLGVQGWLDCMARLDWSEGLVAYVLMVSMFDTQARIRLCLRLELVELSGIDPLFGVALR